MYTAILLSYLFFFLKSTGKTGNGPIQKDNHTENQAKQQHVKRRWLL